MRKNLLTDASTARTGDADFANDRSAMRTYQATVAGTGAVTSTVIIEGSNDGVSFLPIGTITLSGTTLASDGFVSPAPWAFTRARMTAISGTSALVNVTMGA